MLDVGICTVDLTPDYPVIMDGFGARGDRPSEGVDNPITGTCVVFDDGDTRLGLNSKVRRCKGCKMIVSQWH
ncbi:MAG: hypothetical protein R6V19_01165 [Armatimonadota bacterium]